MKTKTKLSLILIFLAVAVCSLFAACKIGGKTWREIVGDAEGQCITYYAGNGLFKNNTNVKNIYYNAETPTLENFAAANQEITNENYLFKGWYYVELDSDGNPKFATDEDREANLPVLTDDEVVFPLTLKKGDHLYIGAKWTRDYKLKYVLYDSGSITVSVEGEIENRVYSDGDVIAESNFGAYDYITTTYANFPVRSTDSTFFEYYVKNEDDEYELLSGDNGRIDKPQVYDENDEDPSVEVYCKFISGVWTMVRTATDVSNMYNNSGNGQKYYVTRDIDCIANTILSLKSGSPAFDCIIEGNGFTISNLKFQYNNMENGTTRSIFGVIAATAEIHNLTFSGIEVTASPRAAARVNIYLFCNSIADGAQLDGVKIDGATLSLTFPSFGEAVIDNIQNTGSGYQTNNWLFGGFASDEAFTGEYGVTYENLKLVIGGKTIDQKNINENQQEA